MRIAIDFDGVLHAYSKGWQDGSIYDQPVDGAREAVAKLLYSGHDCFIFTTRATDRIVNGVNQGNQIQEIQHWLGLHQFPFLPIWTGAGKPFFHVLIDDRAIQFQGDWQETLSRIGEDQS